MAKGARASTKKANNVKLKSKVYGPVESARVERLSAKLLELASQAKPEPAKADMAMDEDSLEESTSAPKSDKKQTEEMEIDQDAATTQLKSSGKGKIEKRRSTRKTSIVFPKYKNGKKIGKAKGKK